MSFLPDGVVAHLREVADLPDLGGTKYRIVRLLARGGMGTVYLAEDSDLSREVAVKVLGAPDPTGDLGDKLRAEARLLARLEHPNIVPIHDAGTLPDGRAFYVMKYVRGRRLDEWSRGGAPRAALLRLFQQVCAAVSFAHARGIVHRDLKPENVMVGPFGEALVLDWGVAKALRGASIAAVDPPPAPGDVPGRASGAATAPAAGAPGGATARGAIIGTPAYMAPEQALGEVDRIDERTDVYALGALLYFLLTGRPPHDGASPAEVLRKVAGESPAQPRRFDPGIPKPLEAICLKALARGPEGRYETAERMFEDVDRFLDGVPVTAHRETLADAAARFAAKNRALLLLLLAYIVMRVAVLLAAGR